MTDIDTARKKYECLAVDWEAFPFWSIEKTGETLDAADRLIAALTARVEELEREQSAPWHVGAFIEVDGLTVGPHMVRDWRERLEQAEAALAAERERAEMWEWVAREIAEAYEGQWPNADQERHLAGLKAQFAARPAPEVE